MLGDLHTHQKDKDKGELDSLCSHCKNKDKARQACVDHRNQDKG